MTELSTEVLNAVCDQILSDPSKRSAILKLIAKNKTAIEKYEQDELNKKNNKTCTPKGLASKTNKNYESPSVRLRRKLLEGKQLENSKLLDKLSSIETKPFEEILQGVKAYVEVTIANEDHSHYVKLLMQIMGANVYEYFTSEVTHVVFLVSLII